MTKNVIAMKQVTLIKRITLVSRNKSLKNNPNAIAVRIKQTIIVENLFKNKLRNEKA